MSELVTSAVRTRRPGSHPVVVQRVRASALGILLGVAVSVVPMSILRPAAAGAADPDGVWPLSPRPAVVRGFDPPDRPWASGHRGLDLAGHVGQPVLAATGGVVSFAGLLAGRGVIVVDHGDVRTTYEPVLAEVPPGARVEAGAVLGELTSLLSHCFPAACLHWGLIRNRDDVYLDPRSLLDEPPVRLLPLWRDLPVARPLLLSYAGSLAWLWDLTGH